MIAELTWRYCVDSDVLILFRGGLRKIDDCSTSVVHMLVIMISTLWVLTCSLASRVTSVLGCPYLSEDAGRVDLDVLLSMLDQSGTG